MAKKDLEKLADELLDQLKKDNRAFREQVSDTRTHYLACSVKSVNRQVIRQLKKRTFINKYVLKVSFYKGKSLLLYFLVYY